MTDAMLTRENQRVGEQLLACRANELSFDILNGHIEGKQSDYEKRGVMAPPIKPFPNK